ncbi:hypothetical protein P0L94_10395 [Microbacter sp. GSS18]|nr:hypothetical protein P0L94_10395 [Microbacter sp. GSS18]
MTDGASIRESANDGRKTGGVSRRQLVKSGVWAAPAIATIAVAPTVAATDTVRTLVPETTPDTVTGDWKGLTVIFTATGTTGGTPISANDVSARLHWSQGGTKTGSFDAIVGVTGGTNNTYTITFTFSDFSLHNAGTASAYVDFFLDGVKVLTSSTFTV